MTALRKTRDRPHPECRSVRDPRERASDVVAREALLDACFGENRHMRTCQRLRDGRAPAEGLAFRPWREGRLVGHRAVVARQRRRRAGADARAAGGRCGLAAKLGVGAALMDHALAVARQRGHARGDPARRRALLRPLRLFGREDRRTVAARPVRARPPARARAARGRARRRLGHDHADRAPLPKTKASRAAKVLRPVPHAA